MQDLIGSLCTKILVESLICQFKLRDPEQVSHWLESKNGWRTRLDDSKSKILSLQLTGSSEKWEEVPLSSRHVLLRMR